MLKLITINVVQTWTISSPDGDYELTNKFKVTGIDFMTTHTYKIQGGGTCSRLKRIKKDSKAIYNPDTKVWFKLNIWHESDMLSIVSDGNCFYFVGKDRPTIKTFVEDFNKYIITHIDLAIELRKQVGEGLDNSNEAE